MVFSRRGGFIVVLILLVLTIGTVLADLNQSDNQTINSTNNQIEQVNNQFSINITDILFEDNSWYIIIDNYNETTIKLYLDEVTNTTINNTNQTKNNFSFVKNEVNNFIFQDSSWYVLIDNYDKSLVDMYINEDILMHRYYETDDDMKKGKLDGRLSSDVEPTNTTKKHARVALDLVYQNSAFINLVINQLIECKENNITNCIIKSERNKTINSSNETITTSTTESHYYELIDENKYFRSNYGN